MPVEAGQLADPCFLFVDDDAICLRYLLYAIQDVLQKFFTVADHVRVIRVSSEKPAAHHGRDIVVNPIRMDDADVPGYLVPDVDALPEHLFTDQQLGIREAVHHRVDLSVVHLSDFFSRKARDVRLEGPEDVTDQLHGHVRDVRILLPPDEVVESFQDWFVPNVAVVAGEVDEEHPAVIVAGLHVVVVQVFLEVPPVKADAFTLLTRTVRIGQILVDRRADHFIANQMIDRLVSHDVAGDVPAVPSLIDRKLYAGCRLILTMHEIVLDLRRLKQLRHLIELRLVLEAAAFHSLRACLIN